MACSSASIATCETQSPPPHHQHTQPLPLAAGCKALILAQTAVPSKETGLACQHGKAMHNFKRARVPASRTCTYWKDCVVASSMSACMQVQFPRSKMPSYLLVQPQRRQLRFICSNVKCSAGNAHAAMQSGMTPKVFLGTPVSMSSELMGPRYGVFGSSIFLGFSSAFICSLASKLPSSQTTDRPPSRSELLRFMESRCQKFSSLTLLTPAGKRGVVCETLTSERRSSCP